jgi:hypothetical protein
VPTVATDVRRGTPGGRKKLWIGLAGAGAIAAGAAVWWVSTQGLPGLPAISASPAVYTTPDQISAAIDTQLQRDHTVKFSSTTDGPQQYEHTTVEEQLQIDGSHTWVSQTSHYHADIPAMYGGHASTLDWDSGIIVMPEHAWVAEPHPFDHNPARFVWKAVPPQSDNAIEIMSEQEVRQVPNQSNPLRQDVKASTIVNSTDEVLDGTPARRYEIRIDLGKAAQLEADPTATPLTPATPSPTGLYELWLDRQNHLLRYRMEIADPPEGANTGGTITFDARYRDWGLPVQINAPPGFAGN